MRVRRVGAALLVVLLAGCSTTGGSPPAAGPPTSSATSPSATVPSSTAPATPTLPTRPPASVAPNAAYGLPVNPRIRLTPLGTGLRVGQPATVAWQPAAGTVGVLRLQVTGVRQGDLADLGAFELDETARGSTPYYVDAIATNRGRSDLGGATVPLLLLDAAGTLVQPSTFETTFAPCSARPLPAPYPKGATGPVCLVFLAPDRGAFAGVVFRPQESYAPITWAP